MLVLTKVSAGFLILAVSSAVAGLALQRTVWHHETRDAWAMVYGVGAGTIVASIGVIVGGAAVLSQLRQRSVRVTAVVVTVGNALFVAVVMSLFW
jgi:hypothetical protein